MNNTSDSYVLCARGLRKDHGRDASLVRAVDGVDLGVAAGETVAIMGPSGCGKSTLLYLLGGLDRPTSGEIWLAGQNLTPMSERGLARLRRERIGFVFQAFHLMDELTAVENVELPALLDGRAPRTARRRATGLLEQDPHPAPHRPLTSYPGRTSAVALAMSQPSASSPAAEVMHAAATLPAGGELCGFAALRATMIRSGRRGQSARPGPYGSSAAVMRGALETAVPARGTAGPAIPAGLEAGLDPAAPAS